MQQRRCRFASMREVCKRKQRPNRWQPGTNGPQQNWARRKIALRGGGGGMARKPICPTPPPSPSLVAVPGGGFGVALPYLPCRGGGGGPTPTCMPQNNPHVALIILTTHVWGKIFFVKKFSKPKFVFRRLWWQQPSLHKTKGPARKPISGTPPPLLRRAPMPSPPPPPPQSNFRAALCCAAACGGMRQAVGASWRHTRS